MKTEPVVPARLELDADGTPLAPEFHDIYHPRHGALEQARHVFLTGNGLPARWRGRDRFVILETGFGLGNNFLATWLAWRDDPKRCPNLHFVSIESRPLGATDLASIPRDPLLVPLAGQLVSAWPPLTANLHRLGFESGRVQLLVAFGDVAAWLPQIEATVDAFFLDGFAPAKNPQMWDARLFKAMARIAAPGATAATWSVARPVREGLRGAGFDCSRAAGHGGKREITIARFAPHFVPRSPPRRRTTPSHHSHAKSERVLVVGAGLAGCAVAWALAEQGIRSTLIERGPTIAGEGSGNAAGLFHGVVHRDDGRHARFNRAAALEASRQVAVAVAAHGVTGSVAGLLRLETQAAAMAGMHTTIAKLGLPTEYVRAVTPDAASELAGPAIDVPAWFYPGGGWVDPRGLARSFIERAGDFVEIRLNTEATGLRRDGERWLLHDADAKELATANIVVLANAGGAFDLLGANLVGLLERRRGQISALPTSSWPGIESLRLAVAGAGYALPSFGGQAWFGATSQLDDADTTVRHDDHRENLERLRRLFAGVPSVDVRSLHGRVSFRYSMVDRLPLVGAVPLSMLGPLLAQSFVPQASPRPEQPRFAAHAPGLYMLSALGSRGIAWSAPGAQVLAAAISGAPAPLEADLLDAIDPARFASRALRRPSLATQPPAGPMAGGSAGA